MRSLYDRGGRRNRDRDRDKRTRYCLYGMAGRQERRVQVRGRDVRCGAMQPAWRSRLKTHDQRKLLGRKNEFESKETREKDLDARFPWLWL